MLAILNLLFFFCIKVIDNILTTSKTIMIQRNKPLLAGLFVFIAEILFYKLIDAVSTNGDLMLYVVSLASGVGTMIAIQIANHFSKEKLFINVLLCDDKKVMIKLREYLKENHITNLATDGYTKNFQNKTIAITAYAQTKDQSKLIDNYLANSDTKIKRIVSVN